MKSYVYEIHSNDDNVGDGEVSHVIHDEKDQKKAVKELTLHQKNLNREINCETGIVDSLNWLCGSLRAHSLNGT